MRFVRNCLARHKDKKEINDVEVGLWLILFRGLEYKESPQRSNNYCHIKI